MKESIGTRLRHMREIKGYSQVDVAAHLNCSNKVISNYELDRRTPDYGTLAQLCDLYGCSADFILGRTDTVRPTAARPLFSETEQELLALMRRLPEDAQKSVLSYTRFSLLNETAASREKGFTPPRGKPLTDT